MAETVPVAELADLVGREVGPSDWIEIDQERIDRFADITEDHQFIHVDPDAASRGPFGTTIAHGFLSLSLLTRLGSELLITPEGAGVLINYGFDKVRFLAPVPSGARIRARATVVEAGERKPGQVIAKYAFTIDIEGQDTPALVAEWLTLALIG